MYAWAWGTICFVGVSILVGCRALDAPVAVITEIVLTRCAREGERGGRGQQQQQLEGDMAAGLSMCSHLPEGVVGAGTRRELFHPSPQAIAVRRGEGIGVRGKGRGGGGGLHRRAPRR